MNVKLDSIEALRSHLEEKMNMKITALFSYKRGLKKPEEVTTSAECMRLSLRKQLNIGGMQQCLKFNHCKNYANKAEEKTLLPPFSPP